MPSPFQNIIFTYPNALPSLKYLSCIFEITYNKYLIMQFVENEDSNVEICDLGLCSIIVYLQYSEVMVQQALKSQKPEYFSF